MGTIVDTSKERSSFKMVSVKQVSEMDTKEICQLNTQKAVLTAENYASISPAMARFLMVKAETLKRHIGDSQSSEHTLCYYCGSIFRPGNYSVRLRRRMHRDKRLDHLLDHQPYLKQKSKGKFQRRLLDLYRISANRLVLHCKHCLHRTVISGQSRRDKQGKDNPSNPQSDKSESLSYAAKKKLKKKEKRRLKASESSRADTESTTSHFSLDSLSSDSGISSNRSLSSISSLNDDTQTPSLPTFMTSTPFTTNPSKKTPNVPFQTKPNSSTLSSIDSSNASQRKKKTKGGGPVHNILKKMLADDLESRQNNHGSSLQKFLSGL